MGGMLVCGGGVVFSVLCGLAVGSGAKIKIMRIIAWAKKSQKTAGCGDC